MKKAFNFADFKSLVKSKGLGSNTFYTVPRHIGSAGIGTDVPAIWELPFESSVDVEFNPKKKKYTLQFSRKGFGFPNVEGLLFFTDKEMAEVYTTRLLAEQHTKFLAVLRNFEDKTKVKQRLDVHLDKFPEVFL